MARGGAPKTPGTVSRSSKLSYRAWLFLQHAEQTPFVDVARLVLGGGPDSQWVNKTITPEGVCDEVEQLYAAKRRGIEQKHVDQARDAIEAYHKDSKSVDKLVEERDVLDATSKMEVLGPMSDAIRAAEAETGLEAIRGMDKVNGRPHDGDGPGGLVRVRCEFVNHRTGRQCQRVSLLGQVFCDLHGGTYLEPEEMREIMRRGQEKVLAVSLAAIDAAVDVMQNSPIDVVRLKAAELLMDRAGLRPGVEIEIPAAAGGPSTSSAVLIDEKLSQLGKHGDSDDNVTVITSLPEKDEQAS